MSSENTTNGGGKSIRLFRPSIIVLCGPAACGKSTFAQRHFRPTQIVSSDWARALVCDDERDQRFNAQAFALVHFLLEQRLTLNRLCVVDSTAVTAQARKDLLELARKCQVPTTLILFNVPLETCVERDGKRERSVGRAIVERQYHALQEASPTIRQEGFDQVVELQDGDLDSVQIDILFRPVQRAPRTDAGAPPRRADRPARGPWSRPGEARNNMRPASKPPATQTAAPPRPAPPPAPPSAPKPATLPPAERPAPQAGTSPAPAAQVAASAVNVPKPSAPNPAPAPFKPAPAADPRQVAAAPKSSGGS
jgi:protein phosphatase